MGKFISGCLEFELLSDRINDTAYKRFHFSKVDGGNAKHHHRVCINLQPFSLYSRAQLFKASLA